jgi:hypothetical protein
MMFARNGITPSVLGYIQVLLDQCGKLYFYGSLARQAKSGLDEVEFGQG